MIDLGRHRKMTWAQVSSVALLLVLGGTQLVTDAQFTVNATKTSLVVSTPNGSLQVYPPVVAQPADQCPGAPWKQWKLHKAPQDYDPLHWNKPQWKDYLLDYPLRSAALSLAFFLIGLGALLLVVSWRLIQWCVSCGHCRRACGVHSDEIHFLGDTKHRYLKTWTYLLIAGALSMVVWGMLALDRNLITSFWDSFDDVMDYGSSVSNNLELLSRNITYVAPTKLGEAADLVNRTVDASRLGGLVQVGLDFNNNTMMATSNLRTDAGAFLSALHGKLLPGLVTLAAQLGKTIETSPAPSDPSAGGGGGGGNSSRRRLAQSTSTSSSSSYGNNSLPALNSSLPIILAANAMRATILNQMQALQAALAGVAAAPSLSFSSPELAALRSALNQQSLESWDMQLGQIASALQVYNASRSSTAFSDTTKAANNVIAGAGSLTSTVVTQLQSRVAVAVQQLNRANAFDAMKTLRLALLNISQQVADVSSWDMLLQNGTRVSILDLSSFVVGALNDYITGDTSNGLRATLAATNTTTTRISFANGLIVNVTDFLQAARNISTLAVRLNTSAISVSAIATNAHNAAATGPDPAAATSQVAAILRPAVASLTNPVAAVAAALNQYGSNNSAANAAALRAAATSAAAAVGAAVTTFTPQLADTAGLETVSRSLTTMLDSALQGLGSSFLSTAPYTYDTLVALDEEISLYQAGLEQLVGFMSQLPDSADAMELVLNKAYNIQDKVSDMSADVQGVLKDAAVGLDAAVSDIRSKVVSPGNDLKEDYQHRSEDISKYMYPAAMGAWGLGAALLLLLALSVNRNWPAGLVLFGLGLLLYITLSQVVTSAVSFSMSTVRDACEGVELVAMRQLVEHSKTPRVAVLLSYYLYKVPSSEGITLQAAFNLDVADVRQRLQSLNQSLVERIDTSYKLRGKTAEKVEALRNLGFSTQMAFEAILNQLRYENVNELYVNSKSVVCCEAGNFAYHEWCAITAMAALSFGALISAFYLLARMDNVRQRKQSCCSCCGCSCYRPYNRYRADVEEAQQEDQFVKQAQKQKELQYKSYYHSHQLQQQQPSAKQVDGYGAAGKVPAGTGGLFPGGHAVDSHMPTAGLMSAAGGVAAVPTLKESLSDPYLAPSAPPLMAFGK